MLNIVLVSPEIPANTGNIGRTCVVTGTRLHLVGPMGFSLDNRMLRRAGLGYWHSLDVVTYDGWDDFVRTNGLAEKGSARLHLLTKKARRTYAQSTYRDGDFLVFGCESSGLPEGLLAALPECCERIPMLPDATSLTDADAWAAENDELSAGAGRQLGGNAAADETGAAGHSPIADSSPILRQDVCGNFVDPSDYRISALNLSNAAAVVLYEALRQTGFPGME